MSSREDFFMAIVIAHRGASRDCPENTIEAFQRAVEVGADWVELDVRRTRDGEVVVHHDADLSDGRVIAETPRAELPEAVPTLAQAMEACAPLGVNIEIKSSSAEPDFDPEHTIAAALIKVARAQRELDKLLVTSFDMTAINAVRDLDPAIPTGFLTQSGLGAEVDVGRATAHSHRAINPGNRVVTPRWVAEAKAHDLEVNVWTVNDPVRMSELVEMGVDGIITDVPDVAVAVLNGEG